MSCGYVGASDGWQDLSVNKRLTELHAESAMGTSRSPVKSMSARVAGGSRWRSRSAAMQLKPV